MTPRFFSIVLKIAAGFLQFPKNDPLNKGVIGQVSKCKNLQVKIENNGSWQQKTTTWEYHHTMPNLIKFRRKRLMDI